MATELVPVPARPPLPPGPPPQGVERAGAVALHDPMPGTDPSMRARGLDGALPWERNSSARLWCGRHGAGVVAVVSATLAAALLVYAATTDLFAGGAGSAGGGGAAAPLVRVEVPEGVELPEGVEDVLASMNAGADPCEDFYEYACGAWRHDFDLEATGYSSYYATFDRIAGVVEQQQLDILLSGRGLEKISLYFDSCLDTESVEALGAAPLRRWIDLVSAPGALEPSPMATLGRLHRAGLALRAFFAPAALTDLRYGATSRLYLVPNVFDAAGVVGSPAARAALSSFVGRAFALAGVDTERFRPSAAVEVERALVSAALPAAESLAGLEDVIASTRAVSPPSSSALSSPWDYGEYLEGLSGGEGEPLDRVDLLLADGMDAMAELELEDDDVRAYLIWHAILSSLDHLPAAFRDLAADIEDTLGIEAEPADVPQDLRRGLSSAGGVEGLLRRLREARTAPGPGKRTLSRKRDGGRRGRRVRARSVDIERLIYCSTLTLSTWSDALAHEWVQEDFPPLNKPGIEAMVEGIHARLGDRLREVDWLDEATRAEAERKWSLIARTVGYSPEWVDYGALNVSGRIFEDYTEAVAFLTARELAVTNRPVDRSVLRGVTVQNAYYDPRVNGIYLPAGLELRPMYSADQHGSLNLAAYGSVVGHELTHSLDSSGRLYNGSGAYTDWWGAAAAEAFEDRARCLVNQFDGYRVAGGRAAVSGEQTLGENIADGGGVRLSWRSYRALDDANQTVVPDEVLGGAFTNDRLFFVKYAQNWCAKSTADAEAAAAEQDEHAPPRWRVEGPLSNFAPFAEAFGCSAGQRMVRSGKHRCEVW